MGRSKAAAVARTVEAERWQEAIALGERVTSKLLAFARRRFGKGWDADCLDDYRASYEIDPMDVMLLTPWALFHRDTHGLPILEWFLAERAETLTPRERALLEAQRSGWLSIFEVERVERGEGLHLHDRLTGARRFVIERGGSKSLRPGAVLLARVVDFEGVSLLWGLHPKVVLDCEPIDLAVKAAQRTWALKDKPLTPAHLRSHEDTRPLIGVWMMANGMFAAHALLRQREQALN